MVVGLMRLKGVMRREGGHPYASLGVCAHLNDYANTLKQLKRLLTGLNIDEVNILCHQPTNLVR